MGYNVTITRKNDYIDDDEANQIILKEFDKLIAEDSEMKIGLMDGVESLIWTNYPEYRQFGGFPFKIQNGEITIKNPNTELLEQMIYISKYINARVESEEGEIIDWDAEGNIIAIPEDE